MGSRHGSSRADDYGRDDYSRRRRSYPRWSQHPRAIGPSRDDDRRPERWPRRRSNDDDGIHASRKKFLQTKDARSRSPRRDTTEKEKKKEKEEEATGWVPIPGKLHPTGLDEVVAMQYGFKPVREVPKPLDEDGKLSDVFLCDKAAYQMFNDAHLQGTTELGAWVAKRLCLGVLLVNRNYDQVPDWRVITLFGRPKVTLETRAKKVIAEWLTLHGQQDDAECVESANMFADSATHFDIQATSPLKYVIVSGNTKFVELLRKDYDGLQQLFMERRVVTKPRDVPFRVWHVTSRSSSQLEEECLNKSLQKYAYQEEFWVALRGINVRSTLTPPPLSEETKGIIASLKDQVAAGRKLVAESNARAAKRSAAL